MSLESWLKISLPAFPMGFTIFGVWGYFHENPLPLLPAPIAFWGLVVCFYLFSSLYTPDQRRYPLVATVFVTILWFTASLASHSLGKFLGSTSYTGLFSLMGRTDFWYAYICAGVAFAAGLWNFLRYEPTIASQIRENRLAIDGREE
jgi:hypothetical protein